MVLGWSTFVNICRHLGDIFSNDSMDEWTIGFRMGLRAIFVFDRFDRKCVDDKVINVRLNAYWVFSFIQLPPRRAEWKGFRESRNQPRRPRPSDIIFTSGTTKWQVLQSHLRRSQELTFAGVRGGSYHARLTRERAPVRSCARTRLSVFSYNRILKFASK